MRSFDIGYTAFNESTRETETSEVEFDIEDCDFADMFAELYELFVGFLKENHLVSPVITYVAEVEHFESI